LENGYHKVTRELQDMGYRIGKKKTYRLMKENRLLLPRQKKGTRDFVRFTQPLPFEPFEKLEMDIKFILPQECFIVNDFRHIYPYSHGLGAPVQHATYCC
jgi:hypothetical protein